MSKIVEDKFSASSDTAPSAVTLALPSVNSGRVMTSRRRRCAPVFRSFGEIFPPHTSVSGASFDKISDKSCVFSANGAFSVPDILPSAGSGSTTQSALSIAFDIFAPSGSFAFSSAKQRTPCPASTSIFARHTRRSSPPIIKKFITSPLPSFYSVVQQSVSVV